MSLTFLFQKNLIWVSLWTFTWYTLSRMGTFLPLHAHQPSLLALVTGKPMDNLCFIIWLLKLPEAYTPSFKSSFFKAKEMVEAETRSQVSH